MKLNDINWSEVPSIITKEQMRLICHCSKRTALYYLKSGKLPCEYSGKKTRCYKIRKEDLMVFLEDKEQNPEYYTEVMSKKLVFHSTNTYYELMKPIIENKQKEAYKNND